MMKDPIALKSAAIVFVVSLAVYIMSLPSGPLFGDGLEFVAAAAVGGVPHPTGYPLITELLGPFSGSYWQAAFACSVFAALGAACWAILVVKLLQPTVMFLKPNQQLVFLTLFGLLAPFSAGLWSAATLVEVYGLNALLMLAALLILARNPEGSLCWRQLSVTAVLISLGLANHLSIIMLIPLFGLRFLESLRLKHTSIKTVALPIVCFVLPVVILYSLLMMRASASPAINWGNAEDLQGLQWLIRGGDYKQTQFLMATPGVPFTVATYLPYAGSIGLLLLSQFGGQLLGVSSSTPLLLSIIFAILGAAQLLLVIVGFQQLLKRSSVVFWGLLIGIVVLLFVLFTYNIPDISDYFLALYCLFTVPLLLGCNLLLSMVIAKFEYTIPEKQPRLVWFAGLLVAVAFLSNSAVGMRQNSQTATPVISRISEALQPNALLITHGDYDTYSFWFHQLVENKRSDVLVVAANFMRNDWYQTMLPLEGQDPHGRYVAVQPASFATLTEKDQLAMIRHEIILPHLGQVPLYTTDCDPLMVHLLSQEFRLVPAAQLIDEEEYLNYARQGTLAQAIPTVIYKIEPLATNGNTAP